MEKFNVLVILLDGLRNDRIHLCPNLLSILKKGYFFSNMITAAPYTLAAYHSIITGLYPSKHGINSYFSMFKFRNDTCKTLTKYLHDQGFYTEFDHPEESVLPSQGFDTHHPYKFDHDKYRVELTKLHKERISRAANKQFFLFLCYDVIHKECIKKIAKKHTDFDREYFNNYKLNAENYNSWIKDMDMYVKEIFDHITNSGLLKNTILIFLSDHGTSNGEKIGEKMYGSFTYDYTIKVFCSFIVPGREGREINYQTMTIDITPTILDILDIEEDKSYEHIQGKSLMPFIKGEEKEDRVAFSETGGLNGPWPSPNKHNVFCIRFKKWKLIYNKTPNSWEMYNLEHDPEEKNNVYDGNKSTESASELKKMLLDSIKSSEDDAIY